MIFAIQFSMEGARLRRAALAAKARRLRYQATDEEVKPPSLEDDESFHTFLSHVWGTGQDQMRIVKQRLVEMMPELHVFLDVDGSPFLCASTVSHISRTHARSLFLASSMNDRGVARAFCRS